MLIFGCAFVAQINETFQQRGQSTQVILSIGKCKSLFRDNTEEEKDAWGFYVHSPNMTVSGQSAKWMSVCLVLCWCV